MNESNQEPGDRRNQAIDQDQPIPKKAVEAGSAQLKAEINIIENWLSDLGETREDNPETILAKATYTDMLLNRKELLNTLEQK